MTEKIKSNTQNPSNIKLVWLSYFKWFCGATLLAIMASIVANWINSFQLFNAFYIKIIQISSLVIEASTLGQLGYDIQTWSGVSSAEKLNKRLFIILATFGFFLIIFSFQLELIPSLLK